MRSEKEEIVFCADLPPRVHESLKTLCCLAAHAGTLRAHEIACSTGLPAAQTAKVLQWMTWAGFVRSRRGAKGGFWLVTSPENIRVSDLIAFFTRRDHQPEAGETDCVLEALQRATTRCQREFKHITVADLVKRYRQEQARKLRREVAPVRRS
jgi:Rrf2 family protein